MSRRGDRSTAWYLLVGGGLLAFGLALVPGVAAVVPVPAAVELAGNDYFLLGAFGVVTLGVLGWTVWRRATSRLDVADPPDPETVPTAPRPGHAFDDAVARSVSLRPWCRASERERLRERLREAALAAEMRRDGCSRDVARERLETGSWTSDPRAARFLRPGEPFPLTVGERLRAVLRGRTSFQRAAKATAEALARRHGGSDGRPSRRATREDGPTTGTGDTVTPGGTGPDEDTGETEAAGGPGEAGTTDRIRGGSR